MSEFKGLINNSHSQQAKLKKLCAPLFQNFGFNSLFYHHISNDGYVTSFGTHIESFEHYLNDDLYQYNPYIRHPDFFQSGLQLIQDIQNDVYQAGINALADKFELAYKVVIIEKTKSGCQGFSFAVNANEFGSTPSHILNHLPLLKCFIQQFKEKGADIIQKTLEKKLPVKEYIGTDFFKKPSLIIPHADELKKLKFLIQMGVLHQADDIALSQREKQCIRYLLQGHTAAETASLLNLSKRTVESYIENIKVKMNCYSKLELFEKFKEIEALGLL